MVWWIGAIVIACDLGLAVVFTPLRLRMSMQGRGETGWLWAAGGGVQVGPVAVSGAAGRSLPATLQVHAWQWQLWQRPVRALLQRGEKKEEKPEEDEEQKLADKAKRLADGARGGYRRFERWFDPLDAVLFVVGERRRLRASRLEIDVDYSFDDVVLTGRMLAAIYVLRAVLPPQVVIREKHSWESVDRFSGAIEGEIEIWPVLAGLDLLWFAVRSIKIRSRPNADGGATEST